MKLDERLMSVANLIRKNKIVADIGTDHAYLPVYLIENGISQYVIASDVRKGPLKNAEKTVIAHNLTEKIELRLSDGLNSFKEIEVDEIAVAGMGGLLISQFIERTEWLKNKDIHLVLQPMTHAEEVRETLYNNGFFIDKECVSTDKNKLYITISAYFTGEKYTYSDFDLIVGKLPQNNDELSIKYLNHLYEKYNKKFIALEKAQKPCENIKDILEKLKLWQQ